MADLTLLLSFLHHCNLIILPNFVQLNHTILHHEHRYQLFYKSD